MKHMARHFAKQGVTIGWMRGFRGGREGGSEGGSEGVRCLRILCEGEGGVGRNKSMVANIKHLCSHRLASL